jgi:hypothetical protein
MACTKNPNMENIARRPFFSSFTCRDKHGMNDDWVLRYGTLQYGLLRALGVFRVDGRIYNQVKTRLGDYLKLSEGVGVVSETQGVE